MICANIRYGMLNEIDNLLYPVFSIDMPNSILDLRIRTKFIAKNNIEPSGVREARLQARKLMSNPSEVALLQCLLCRLMEALLKILMIDHQIETLIVKNLDGDKFLYYMNANIMIFKYHNIFLPE